MNNTFVNDNQVFYSILDYTDAIKLEEVHLSIDYGLLMMWNIAKPMTNYKCNTLFVFEQVELRNVLRNSSPVNCEYNRLNRPNAFTIIIPEGFDFVRGEAYKFCLTLFNNEANPTELLFGCSKYIDISTGSSVDHTPSHKTINTSKTRSIEKLLAEGLTANSTDVSTFDKIAEYPMNETKKVDRNLEVKKETSNQSVPDEEISELLADDLETKRKVLVALGVGILLASICILLVALCRVYAQRRRRPPTTICHSVDSEYVKLQATTTL